jgi:AcrR family transcriptional regulator
MNTELRRATIVAHTLRLIIEHGPNVTTSQIAGAAGIAEGTIFRAFRDKRELLMECMRTALDSDAEARIIKSIDRALPLTERLVTAIGHATEYQHRLFATAQAVHAAGIDLRKEQFAGEHGLPEGMMRVTAAIAGLFDPDAEDLRVEPEPAARMLLGLVFASRLDRAGLGHMTAEPGQIVDLFLHGALHTKGN